MRTNTKDHLAVAVMGDRGQGSLLRLPGLKWLGAFRRERDLDLIFHCDRHLHPLPPNLVEAGLDCIHRCKVLRDFTCRNSSLCLELVRKYGQC